VQLEIKEEQTQIKGNLSEYLKNSVEKKFFYIIFIGGEA